MTIMSPSTCSQALRGQAVTFMLREVMLIVDLEWYSTHLSSFMPLPTLYRPELSRVHMVQCEHMCMTTITLHAQSFNFLLTEMITPQTQLYKKSNNMPGFLRDGHKWSLSITNMIMYMYM